MAYKTLYILRHAKAEPAGPFGEDRVRPLAERGQTQAEALGKALARERRIPAQVLCSPAARTRQTWELVAQAFSAPPPVEYAEALYMATPEGVLALIRHTPDAVPTLMVVGHNPAFHQLAAQLAEDGDPALLDALSQRFPPCTLAEIRFETARWADLAPGKGRLMRLEMA